VHDDDDDDDDDALFLLSSDFQDYYAAAPGGEGVFSDDAYLTSSVSVAYVGHKSKKERPRKTKIGTDEPQVTYDSYTQFKVKRSRSQGQLMFRRKMCHFLVADRATIFKCGRHIECGQFVPTHHKLTPKWTWPGSRNPISKFWDLIFPYILFIFGKYV